ncbi:6-phospho-3-hexuloisomerase [Aequitasia blattaphilus]|uniref:SIS domain-containing protein n=1 Tax=Aequitasia blattaphilus TaxID=2949332 RepID=A0ABT1EA49_9FIRM|nr:SIS domain-containing protein [Aequitasia blattaphilus]MCP1102690.1 SIS domain-containing protein [Aequitasia blattaphilus]MCR8615330.1 SIS domain-containing protein [Aequitasia blattaphilus]
MEDKFQKTALGAVSELKQVFERIQIKDVDILLQKIQEKSRIFLLGAGREGIAVRAFTMRLMHLGKEVHWIWDETTPAVQEGDLFICACGSADVGHENYICKMAKEAGAELLLITPANTGYLLEIADYIVQVPAEAYKAQGDFVPTQQLMGNLFEQALFIFFDVVIMLLKEELHISSKEMVARHRNVE